MSTEYDAIVVGARCGGSPTAMLLARNGYRVLLVDKATFPSDTMSTHLVHPPAVAALARWGILERLEATNCPPITRYSFDFGPVTVSGSPRPANGAANAYGPRRIVLDALLVEAAVSAGAELREAFTVEEVVVDDGRVTGIRGHAKGGDTVTERARVVIGADGKHSLVAKAVQPERYNEMPPLAPSYYAYWSGLPTDGFEIYIRAESGRGWAAIPTHDDLTCVVQGWPQSEFAANRKDVEGTYMKSFELAPEFAERIHGATAGDALRGHGRPARASSTSPTDRDGRSSAMPATTSIRSRRSGSPTRSVTRRRWRRPSTKPSPGAVPTTTRWPTTSALGTRRRCPIYGFTCDFAKLEPPPPRCSSSSGRCRGTRRRWTAS